MVGPYVKEAIKETLGNELRQAKLATEPQIE